jgi:hypothetical protein
MQKLLLGVFLCGCVSATAQAPQSQSARSAVRSPQPAPGRSVNRQPPTLGDNISQLINRLILAGGLKGKDEFETTEQYDARRKAGAAKYGTLVFVLPPDAPDLTYSADAEEMKINLRTNHTYFDDGGSTSGDTFVVRNTLISKSSYVGTNAFGVKKLIQSTVSKDYGVIVEPGSPLHLNEVFTAFTFSMDTEEARVSKRFLRVALVGKLTESRVHASEERHSPTVTEPWDSLTEGLYIRLLLEEVRVLDSRTGEGVSNFTPDMKVGK